MASFREVPSSVALAFYPPVLRSFSRRNPSSPRFPPLHVFSWASLRIQTRQPSTSTTIHRQRLRHLTLLEMHRLRRMFENVFSPLGSSLSIRFSPLSLFLSLSFILRQRFLAGILSWQMEISRPACCQKCWRNALVFHPVAASWIPCHDVYPPTTACVPFFVLFF